MLIITLPGYGGVDLISLGFMFGCTSKVNDSCITMLVHLSMPGRTKPIPAHMDFQWKYQKAQGSDSQLCSDSAKRTGINVKPFSLITASLFVVP